MSVGQTLPSMAAWLNLSEYTTSVQPIADQVSSSNLNRQAVSASTIRPTLSKVLWGQSVGRGLRSARGKDKCVIIDVSSNWSTFGPVEKLEWSLWSHRKSYMQFMNRFNWIGQQQDGEDSVDIHLLCKNELSDGNRCSHIYKKGTHEDDTCPVCGTYAAVDIYKEQKAGQHT